MRFELHVGQNQWLVHQPFRDSRRSPGPQASPQRLVDAAVGATPFFCVSIRGEARRLSQPKMLQSDKAIGNINLYGD
ncbi:MAG: hypothetical protein MK135_11090 [Polyangiaceae bacterium]|nr:hypothetical protein [Polyangiaceae bacterium]